jgi:hypothetical protein
MERVPLRRHLRHDVIQRGSMPQWLIYAQVVDHAQTRQFKSST